MEATRPNNSGNLHGDFQSHSSSLPQKLPKNLSLGSLVISVAKRRSGLKITVEITRVIGPGGFHLIFCIRARP
jgi:hypothetical protein